MVQPQTDATRDELGSYGMLPKKMVNGGESEEWLSEPSVLNQNQRGATKSHAVLRGTSDRDLTILCKS